MTPKIKAEELVKKCFNYTSNWTSTNKLYKEPTAVFESGMKKGRAIQCALIAVEELINCTPSVNGRPPNYQDVNEFCCEYWQEVKTELLAL